MKKVANHIVRVFMARQRRPGRSIIYIQSKIKIQPQPTEPLSHVNTSELGGVPKLLARLNSDKPARLHPRPGRMLDRRAHLEFALRRSLIVAREHELEEHELRKLRLKDK
jgi:hypothetical protein